MTEPETPVVGPLLLARDFQSTLGFYEILLGVTAEGAAPYAKLRTRSSTLSVVDGRWWSQVSGSEYSPFGGAGPSQTLLMVQVADVESEFERLVSRGVRFLSPPLLREKIGARNAFLRDPDGRTVMLSSTVS